MERTKRDRKYGVYYSFLLLLLSLFVFSGISEAGVTLSPRYNGTSIEATREQYVYFGKYDHRLETYDGLKEGSPTPILWRVMELKDHSGSQKGAILLSHYVLESIAYQGTTTGSPNYYRPETTIPANTWYGSEVQSWLNSSDVSVTVKLGVTDVNANIKGFLHTDYFSTLEQGLMLDYPYSRYNETESVPAAGKKIVLPSGKYEDIGGSYVDKYEMGTWFASAENDANNNTRKAHFKGGSASFTQGSSDGWYYWTRSPVASHSIRACSVSRGGGVYNHGVRTAGAAVRPAFFLNLESVIFKSASEDFVPGSPSAAAGGSPQNPYILVLPSAVPTGAPTGWLTKFASEDKTPDGATINGKNLTVSWDVSLSPAVKRWPALGDFRLSTGETATSITSDDANPKLLKLTFATGVTAGATVTLSYNLNTDAISYDSSGSPVKVVGSFTKTVTNTTPSGGGGGGDTPSGDTTPTGVGATIGGQTYPAQVQTDGTYLITLPSGASLSALTVSMTLPSGASILPSLTNPFDFVSENPRKFTITAEDGTTKREIWIKIATGQVNPAPTEKAILTVNGADCAVIYTLNTDGSVSVEIQIPFASGITPSNLENLMIALKNSGLSNVKFYYVNEDGTVVPYTGGARASAVKAPYLRVSGTAASVASLANEAITSISYRIKGSTVQYVQTFPSGGLKLSGMNVTDNTKPEPEPEPEPKPKPGGGGGCNAGAGLGALGLLLGGASLLRKKQ